MRSSEKHLLLIVHRIPYPPDKGDKIRSYHEFRFLKEKGWRIHLATFIDDAGDEKHIPALREQCETSFFQRIDKIRRNLAMAGALLTNRPLSVAAFYHPAALAYVRSILARYPVKAVLCYSSPTAEYIFRTRDLPEHAPLVCDFIDVDSDKWRQYAQKAPLWQRWIYAREARCLAAYEKRIADRFDAGVAVSEPEAALLRTVTGCTAGVHAIPNGVDMDYFHPATGDGPCPSEKEFTLVCCGLMDYYPNVDGVLWFAREVWPVLKDRIPTPRLTIVGANPAREIRRLGSHSGIEVTGRVPDIRPYVWRASVAIAPMRIARGIQNKVLEAMAMGKPVVATRQAFEGIDALSGEDLMVADDAAGTFAEKIISLWQDPALAKTMGARARQTMVRNYAWERHLNALNNLLENTP